MTEPRKRKPAKGAKPPKAPAKGAGKGAAQPSPWIARLKALRDRLGLTQEQAAASIRATRQSWIAWEKGRATPAPQAQLLIEMLESGKLP